MKKSVLLLLWSVLAPYFIANAWELPLSVGGGGFINLTYQNIQWDEADGSTFKETTTFNGVFGAWAFFDGAFLELSAGLGGTHGIQGEDWWTFYDGNGMVLQMAAFGKYPFKIGSSGVYYPLIGVDFQRLLLAMDRTGIPFSETALEDAKEWYNSTWLKLGAGLDLDMTQNLYFRAQFLYGFKFYSKPEQEVWESRRGSVQLFAYHGPTFRIAVGYKLYTFNFGN